MAQRFEIDRLACRNYLPGVGQTKYVQEFRLERRGESLNKLPLLPQDVTGDLKSKRHRKPHSLAKAPHTTSSMVRFKE